MRLLKIFILSIFSCSLAQAATPSAPALKELFKVWTSAQITGPISSDKKWKYYIAPRLRFIDDKYKFEEASLYLGLSYQITPQVIFLMGGYRRYLEQSNGTALREYRVWEEVDWDVLEHTALQLALRTRIEERKNIIHAQVANRLRERVKVKLPFLTWRNYYFVFSDELFVQLNQPAWVTNRVIAENRGTLGMEIPINKTVSYEIGYLNQFQFQKTNQMANIIYVDLTVAA